MIISALAYLGLADFLVGGLALIRPRLLRLHRRRHAAPFFATAMVLASAGAWWPVGLHRATQGTLIAEYLPESQFGEIHATVVRATPEQVLRAVHAVTPGEIRFLRVLTWIRSPRFAATTSDESILAPDWHAPMLDFALRTTFVLLGEIPGQEVALGTVVCCGPTNVRTAQDFRALDRPGHALAAIDFRAMPLGDGTTRLTTETRVRAVGSAARWRFGLYWSFIYPGSSLIRRGWLEAIRKRAEEVARTVG
ncbi:MAG: hypothetical protein HY337_01960 [Gemmatimonadetes bacterium]|nr:hypothetical protein [Gemmatimonadota bacterium]